MAFKWRRKALMLKAEGTYGVDPTPAAATDAVLARNVSLRPLILDADERTLVLPWFGNFGKLVAGKHVEIDFDVEMAGAGAAGTVPAYGPALVACEHSQTVNAGTSVVYAPITTGEGSCTIYFYLDGRLHKILGARGTVSMSLEAGRIPVFKFKFVGLFATPTDTAIITPTVSAFVKPLAVNFANTTPATLHTFAGKIRSLSIDQGNVVSYRNLVGAEVVSFTDRKASGSIKMEDELVATKDWWTIAGAATLGALTITQGTAAGNKVTIAGANVQVSDPAADEENGVAMITMGLDFTPSSAGNDEYSITVL